MVDLGKLRRLTLELDRRARDNPLQWMQWLPGQHAFLRSTSKRTIFRAGFQWAGKTQAGAAELIYRMTGRHPFKPVRPPPIRAWVVCGALLQSRIIQERVWQLVPKSEVAPGCVFDPAKGAFVGQVPRLILRNGSIAEFRSGGAKGANLTSGTLDYIWNDEPPESEVVFDDLQKRLARKNGDLFLTFTPLHRPVDYLRERVEKGLIEDLHFKLTPENLIPVGSTRPMTLSDGTPMDADWIAEKRAETSPLLAPVILDGDWETRYQGAYFDGAWKGQGLVDSHIHTRAPRGTVRVCIGIDHGHRPGKQVIYIILVDEEHVSGHPNVYVLDEYVDEGGAALPERDARGLLSMLDRHGMTWSSVDHAFGDRVHLPGSGSQKSNRDLQVQIAKILKISPDDVHPPIRTVKKGADSRSVGERWLYQAMVRGTFGVHPRCRRLIEAIPKYTGRDDEWKDPIDALRYGLSPYVQGWWQRSSPLAFSVL